MWALLLAALLAVPAGADDAASALAHFKGQEAWMLSVILSDPEQKLLFDMDAAGAKNPGDTHAFELRWRKRVVEFAKEYHRHLTTTDILPNAPTVEKMVNDWEFAVMNHWLNHQPAAKQKQVLSDISEGNSAIGWFRGKVEERIRESRKEAARELAAYVASPDAVAASQYVAKPAVPAIDQARQAANSGRGAQQATNPEEAVRRADQVFSGTAPKPGETSAPVVDASAPPAKPGLAGETVPGLTAPLTASSGGFKISAPPSPMVNRESPAAKKGSALGILAKKFAPAAGGILGAIVGFLLGGPIGALIGAAAGAAAGYGARKLLD